MIERKTVIRKVMKKVKIIISKRVIIIKTTLISTLFEVLKIDIE